MEYPTLQWAAWYNALRLMEPLGYRLPVEDEAQYYLDHGASATVGVN